MTTSSKLFNEFLHIPKLNVSGSNLVLYKKMILWALDACAILDHIDETGAELDNLVSKKSWDAKKLSDEAKKLENEWKKECRQEVFIVPLWFLLESGGIFLAERIAIPGTIYSSGIEPFWNWHWNGPEQNLAECSFAFMINHQCTPSEMFSFHRGVHRALKTTCQWV